MKFHVVDLKYPYSENDYIQWATITIDMMDDDHTETVDSLTRFYQENWPKTLEKRDRNFSQEVIQKIPQTKFLTLNENNEPIGLATIQYRIDYTKVEHIEDEVPQDLQIQSLPTMCYFYIYINKKYRRNGAGTALLKYLLKTTEKSSIEILFTFAETNAATRFLSQNGGKLTEEGNVYRLELNADLRNSYSKRLSKCPDDLEFEVFVNPTLELYHQFIETYSLSKQNEPGSESFDRFQESYNPEELYQSLNASGNTQIIGIANIIKNDETKVVGVTVVAISDSFDRKCFQKYTGVHPNYTNKGIATLLKAYTYNYIIDNYPLMEIIETETVKENISSIIVNEKLGYKIHQPQDTFEFYVKYK